MSKLSIDISRRKFLKTTGAAAAVSAFAPIRVAAAVQARTAVGCQLYCLRAELPKDPGGVLAELKTMGYQVVEFAGFLNRTPAQWRKLLDDNGLEAEGHHVPYSSLLGDALKKTIDDNAVIGNKQLILPSLRAAERRPHEAATDDGASERDEGFAHSRHYLRRAGDEIMVGLETPLEMVRHGTLDPREGYSYAKARENLVLAGVSPRATFMRTIEEINQIAEKLKPAGMRLGIHSEADLFKDVDGARPWDVLTDNTSPDVVLQLDTGNVQAARPEGVDVVAVFKRNPNRIKTMHVKPFSSTKPAAYIGEDQLPWKDILAISQAQKIDYYIIEYEVPGIAPLEALKGNLAEFRKFYSA